MQKWNQLTFKARRCWLFLFTLCMIQPLPPSKWMQWWWSNNMQELLKHYNLTFRLKHRSVERLAMFVIVFLHRNTKKTKQLFVPYPIKYGCQIYLIKSRKGSGSQLWFEGLSPSWGDAWVRNSGAAQPPQSHLSTSRSFIYMDIRFWW